MPELTRLNEALADRYTLERELGEGGMATVYLARDEKHGRAVALKVLKPELSRMIGTERFLAEIETTARLQHPHILPLFDSGDAGGVLYYVMPYVEGESLRDRLDRERQLPVEEAVAIALKVAGALAAAHGAGVIHRDIKPANILLSKGEPLVADFGIALALSEAGGVERLTETGAYVGTPHYLAPEQATGEQPVGPRADVYALGCVLYEMLVGEPPFTGTTAHAVLGSILTGDVPAPSSERRSVPPNVDATVARALEKLPADRFAGASDFAAALADEGFRHRAAGRPGRGRGRRRVAALAVTLAAVTLAAMAVAAWALLRPVPEGRGPLFRVPMSFEDDEALAGTGYFDLSDDGSLIVYQGVGEAGTTQLWVRRGAAAEATPIAGTEGIPASIVPDIMISPDAEQVAFWRDRSFWVVPIDGGVPRQLADSVAGWSTWSPSGEWIYLRLLGNPALMRIPAAGGPPEPVTEPDTAAGDRSHMWPDVLPGDDVLVFEARGRDGSRILAKRLDSGETVEVVEGRYPRYAEGRLLFSNETGTRLLSAPFDADRLGLTGPARTLVAGLAGLGHPLAGSVGYAVSRSGLLAYAPRREWELIQLTIDGASRRVDPGWTASDEGQPTGIALSPNGSRIALGIGGPGELDVWVKQLDDGPLTRLTATPGNEAPVGWLDDETLLYLAGGDTGYDLWSARADGSGSPRLVYDHPASILDASVTADGRWVVFHDPVERGTGGRVGADLWVLRPGVDSTARVLVPTPAGWVADPALSPEGRWVAYTSFENGRGQVMLRPFPDVTRRRVQVSVAGGSSPAWSADGERLYFVSGDGELVVADLDADVSDRPVTRTLVPLGHELDPGSLQVTPDGEFLLFRSEPRIVLLFNWTQLAGD